MSKEEPEFEMVLEPLHNSQFKSPQSTLEYAAKAFENQEKIPLDAWIFFGILMFVLTGLTLMEILG